MTIKYDPQEVTDWLTPLEKVYARQSQQLDRYHQQLRERDRQEVEATIDLPEVFSKLSTFSQAIGKVVEARTAHQKTKVSSELEGLYTHPEDPEHVRKYFEYYNSKKNILKTDTEYLERLHAIKNKDLRNYLLNASAKKHIYAKEFFFSESLKALPQKFQEHEDGLDEEKAAAYQRDIKPYAEKNRNYMRGWANDYLAVFKPSNGLVSGILNEGVNKWLDTATTTDKLKANQIIHDEQELQIDRDIPTQAGLGKINAGQYSLDWINERANLVYGKDNPDGKALAKEDYKDRIVRLRRSNTLSSDQLDNILEAELVDYSGGKTGKDIFTKAQYNEIAAADQEADLATLTQTRAVGKQQLVERLNKGYAGGYTSQEEFDADVLPYKSLVSSEDWKLAENFNFVSQSKSVYNREAEHFNNSISNGTFLTKSNIDRVKNNENNGIVTDFGEKQKALIQHQKDNLFADFETRNISNSNIVSQDSGKLTLADGEPLGVNTWPGKLSLEMTKWEDIYYQKYYNQNPNDPDIPTRVATAMKALKAEKGFGIPIGEDGAGEWSKDNNGNYPNFINAKVGKITIKDNVDTWDKDFTSQWMWSKYKDTPQTNRVDILVSTPGTIVTPAANVDMIVSGNLTPEFIYKIGKIPGLTEGEALIQMTEGLINSKVPEHKQLVELYDLKNKLKDLTTPSTDGKEETPLARKIKAEQYLTDLVDEIGDPDISNIHKIGLDKASPKQINRYYARLQMISDITNDETEMNAYPVTQ